MGKQIEFRCRKLVFKQFFGERVQSSAARRVYTHTAKAGKPHRSLSTHNSTQSRLERFNMNLINWSSTWYATVLRWLLCCRRTGRGEKNCIRSTKKKAELAGKSIKKTQTGRRLPKTSSTTFPSGSGRCSIIFDYWHGRKKKFYAVYHNSDDEDSFRAQTVVKCLTCQSPLAWQKKKPSSDTCCERTALPNWICPSSKSYELANKS